nr:general secretion pathway protein GspK [Desulfobulbaceae bacterium]
MISSTHKNQKGFALVVVIVVMLMASFLASELIMLVRTELKISHNIKARAAGHFLAEAGISLGLFRVLGQRPIDVPAIGLEEDWENFYEGYEYDVYIPSGKVTYYVANENGKIDLNRSSPELLRLFLESFLGEDQEEQIDDILASLLDWRDSDDLYRDIGGRGAESETYGELEDPYIARNGPIGDPAEFFLINATEPLFGKFVPQEVFTVHNTSGKINFNSLSPAMLDFLTGGAKERVQAYREFKKELKRDLNQLDAREILGDSQYEKFQNHLDYKSKSNFYTIVGKGFLGVTQEDEFFMPDEDQIKKKTPGIMSSLLIEKTRTGSKYITRAWQEQYI